MYAVSTAWRTAMDAQVRECASHCRIYIGVFDATAAADATPEYPAAVSWSAPAKILQDATLGTDYAAFETDYFRLDGAQFLLPDDTAQCTAQALVSAAQAGADGAFTSAPTITVTFGETHTMVGLTLTFGDLPEDVPAQITAAWYSGTTQLGTSTVTTGLAPVSRLELGIDGADKITLAFDKAHGPYGRARLRKIAFGIGYTYQDSEIKTVTDKHTDSPCSTEVPSASLSFDLDNSNGRFDVDSTGSLVKFLADGQQITLTYGTTISGAEEWIPAGVWYLTGWSTSGDTASFTAEDELARLAKTTYERGVYDWATHTLYSMAEAVLSDAGVTSYYLDTRLKNIAISAPLPITTHAAALQLIANMGLCRIYAARGGAVYLSALTPYPAYKLLPYSSGSKYITYSDPASVMAGNAIDRATFEPDYFRLDGSQYLLPDDISSSISGSGMTSKVQYDGTEKGLLTYFVSSDVPFDVFRVVIDFGGLIPQKIVLFFYTDGAWKSTYYAPKSNLVSISLQALHAERFQIDILAMPKAGQRAHFHSVNLSTYDPDFALDDAEIFNSPDVSLKNKLRNVTASWTYRSYYPSVSVQVASTKITTNSGWARIEHDLCYGPTATITDTDVTLEQTNYGYVSYVRLTASTTKEVDVTITGNKMYEVPYPLTAAANDTGEDLPVTNPLYDGMARVQATIDWMRDYYKRRTVYSFDARGVPEYECGDFVLDRQGDLAQIIGTELTYNGAFREKFTLRKE